MENKKLGKFEIETERLLSDALTFHQTKNIMKNLKIVDDTIAAAIGLTVKEAKDDEINEFICNVKAEEILFKNDLEILENTSEVILNRE